MGKRGNRLAHCLTSDGGSDTAALEEPGNKRKAMTEESNERVRDELDAVIDRCGMIARTGKSRDELHRMMQKATMCLNMASCLADVIETLVMDSECILRPFGATFEREDKMNFKRLTKALEDAQKCARRCCIGLYKHEQADEFAEDCDWWYNMVRLLADRTGEDELKTLQVINWLTTMPSVLGMFDVKKRDFKRIRL